MKGMPMLRQSIAHTLKPLRRPGMAGKAQRQFDPASPNFSTVTL
jgi:hypothetical protein